MRQKKRALREQRKRKKSWILLVPILIFAVGAGIFLYPAVSNFLAEKNHENVIRSYQSKVENTDTGVLEEAWKQAEEYNENLAGDPVHDPFVMGSGYVLPENYEEVLNINGDGVMGYVNIPKIDVYLPIYHGTSEEVLQEGAGHLEATALPIGGDNRHSVISAHRGLPSAELFTRLDEMEIGDVFYIHVLERTLAYEVDQIEIILPEELDLLVPEKDKDFVTLLTCTPYAVNTHRLLVRGSRIPYEETEENGSGTSVTTVESTWIGAYLFAVVIGVALIVIIALIIIVVRAVRKKRRR